MLFLVILGLFLINLVFEDLKKSNTFWLACALVDAEAVQDLRSSMSCDLNQEMLDHLTIVHVRKWVGSLSTSGLFSSFTHVKLS